MLYDGLHFFIEEPSVELGNGGIAGVGETELGPGAGAGAGAIL